MRAATEEIWNIRYGKEEKRTRIEKSIIEKQEIQDQREREHLLRRASEEDTIRRRLMEQKLEEEEDDEAADEAEGDEASAEEDEEEDCDFASYVEKKSGNNKDCAVPARGSEGGKGRR